MATESFQIKYESLVSQTIFHFIAPFPIAMSPKTQDMIDRVDTITKDIEHIRDIVSTHLNECNDQVYVVNCYITFSVLHPSINFILGKR